MYVCLMEKGGAQRDEQEDSKSPGLLDEDERGLCRWLRCGATCMGRHNLEQKRAFEKRAPISYQGGQISLSGGFDLAFLSFQFTEIFSLKKIYSDFVIVFMSKLLLVCVWRRRIFYFH